MGLGSIVSSVVNKAVEVVKPVVDTFTNPIKAAEKIAPTISQFNSVAENMTGRLLGNDPISDITRTAVRTAENLVAPVAENVTKGILGDIGDFFGGAFDGVKDFAGNIINRAVDAGRTIIDTNIAEIVGFGRSVVEGAGQFLSGVGQVFSPSPIDNLLRGDFSGAFDEFKNNLSNGFQNIGGGLVKATIQSVADTAIVGLNGLVSSVQTLIGAEPPSRGLNEREIAELQKIYGDSIDYSQIRIKEGNLGIANGLAPHTVGNTIYIPEGWLDPNSANYQADRSELLAHETAHVWQYQNGGTDYIGESLWNQFKGWVSGQSRNAAYDFGKAIDEGKSWADLNPEQQAALMEESYRDGLFTDPNARLVYNGTDYTDFARGAIAEMRAGRGAP